MTKELVGENEFCVWCTIYIFKGHISLFELKDNYCAWLSITTVLNKTIGALSISNN